MFLFLNLPHKLFLNDTLNTSVVFKIDITNTDKDLVEVDDFVSLINHNHKLFLELEGLVDNKYNIDLFNILYNRLKLLLSEEVQKLS